VLEITSGGVAGLIGGIQVIFYSEVLYCFRPVLPDNLYPYCFKDTHLVLVPSEDKALFFVAIEPRIKERTSGRAVLTKGLSDSRPNTKLRLYLTDMENSFKGRVCEPVLIGVVRVLSNEDCYLRVPFSDDRTSGYLSVFICFIEEH
jgi:hypothetical protein